LLAMKNSSIGYSLQKVQGSGFRVQNSKPCLNEVFVQAFQALYVP